MSRQASLSLDLVPAPGTVRHRDEWEFVLTDHEVMLLRKPITPTSGGRQSWMREAATRIYPGNVWRVSFPLMVRLCRLCTQQGPHGGYQGRLPLRVLSPIFLQHQADWQHGLWFYGKQEGDDANFVKLGETANPLRRNRPYATDNPRQLRTLFCLWDASGIFENVIKQRYRQWRLPNRQEWYFRTPPIDAFVRRCLVARTTTEL